MQQWAGARQGHRRDAGERAGLGGRVTSGGAGAHAHDSARRAHAGLAGCSRMDLLIALAQRRVGPARTKEAALGLCEDNLTSNYKKVAECENALRTLTRK